jgi:hypothetical protein
MALIWPLTPKKFALVGSTKFALARRSAFGNENPRSIVPFTTLNMVVTPQIPSANTTMARVEKARSLRRTRNPMRTSCTKVSSDMVLKLDEGPRALVPALTIRQRCLY